MIVGGQRLYSLRHEMLPGLGPLERLRQVPFVVCLLAYTPPIAVPVEQHEQHPEAEWEVSARFFYGGQVRRYVVTEVAAQAVADEWAAEERQVQELIIALGEQELAKSNADYARDYGMYQEFWGPAWWRQRVETLLTEALTWSHYGRTIIRYVGRWTGRAPVRPLLADEASGMEWTAPAEWAILAETDPCEHLAVAESVPGRNGR